ncbi:MAG: aldo/keto reductase [Alphaproteobacteria bacterium]
MELNDLFKGDGGTLKVSVVGIGCNAFGGRIDEAATRAVIHTALDCGINFFDTADIYGGEGVSEEFVGRALGKRRADIVLASKFGMSNGAITGGGGREYIARAVEDSLRRLGTDCIDLYQFHKPDPNIPVAETLEALDRLVQSGKVRHIGCSNMSAAQLSEALGASSAGNMASFVTAQNRYNLLDRDIEDELAPLCEARGIGILPFYPLARGMLTGKYRRGEPPPAGTRLSGSTLPDSDFDVLEPLEAFCAERDHSLLELAISWLAAQPAVPCVIAGVTRPEQVAANARATEWKLSVDDLAEIDRITGR